MTAPLASDTAQAAAFQELLERKMADFVRSHDAENRAVGVLTEMAIVTLAVKSSFARLGSTMC